MNCKEHYLPELELATGQVREALQCLLHTVLFIRAPGPVAPRDVHCEEFDLTYTRIASVTNQGGGGGTTNRGGGRSTATSSTTTTASSSASGNQRHQVMPIQPPSTALDRDVDQKVDNAIEKFLRSLTPIGPELLQGFLTLGFFERRASRQLFGLVSHEEKVVWEQWIFRVVVNNTPKPVNDDKASVIERQRMQDTADGYLRAAMHKIFEIAGGAIDHIPPVMYEFEISTTKRADERENMTARVANMPSLINLGS